jgi:sugar phosphate isomerase/epimerase
MNRRSFLSTGAAFAAAPLLTPLRAFAQGAPRWPFFAFDNGVGRGKWPAEKQAATLKALGYDGISYNYTNNKDLETWIRVYHEAGLKIFGLYFPVSPLKDPPWNPALREAITMLKGSETVLWITLPAEKTKAPADYDAAIVKVLREFGNLAQASGLRVAIYPHVGFYAAVAADSHRLAKLVAHPAVGSSYNLCHEFLSGIGGQAMGSLTAFGPEASLVSINGVDPADKKRFILPLGEGSFDMAAFLAELKRIGYKGPVGHQFYNIPGDIETNLKAAMAAWRKQQPS